MGRGECESLFRWPHRAPSNSLHPKSRNSPRSVPIRNRGGGQNGWFRKTGAGLTIRAIILQCCIFRARLALEDWRGSLINCSIHNVPLAEASLAAPEVELRGGPCGRTSG